MSRSYTLSQINRAYALKQYSLSDALGIVWQEDMDKEAAAYQLTQIDPRGMTKDEIIEATWKLPMLDESLYELLHETGFKTGSSVYAKGVPAKDEDWCVVMAPQAFSGYVIGLGDNGYWEQDGFSSVYAHRNGMLLNIICFSSMNLYYAWQSATTAMVEMTSFRPVHSRVSPFHELFKDKWRRVRVFRAIKDICTTPVKLSKPIAKGEALHYSKCSVCGLEAINFTCKAAKEAYLETAICERCA